MKIATQSAPLPEAKKSDALATLDRTAKAFEALLYKEMVKAMVQSSTEGGFFGEENGAEAWEELFESGLSDFLAGKQGLGIARRIYEQYAPTVGQNDGAQGGAKSADP